MRKIANSIVVAASILLFGVGCQTTGDNSPSASGGECEPLSGWEMNKNCFSSQEAMADWELAQENYKASIYNMGLRFSRGKGVSQSYKAAYRFYKLAAEQGVFRAHNNLAVLSFYGRGVKNSHTRAYMWFKVAQKSYEKSGEELPDRNLVRIFRQIKPFYISEGRKLAEECIKKNYLGC